MSQARWSSVTDQPRESELSPLERLPEEWLEILENYPGYRARQIFSWIHGRGVVNPEQMTDLPRALRAFLKDRGLGPCARLVDCRISADNTRKLIIELADGFCVESVLIPQKPHCDGDDLDDGTDVTDEALDDGIPSSRSKPPKRANRQNFSDFHSDTSLATNGDSPRSATPKQWTEGVITQCISTQVGCAMGCKFCASGRAGLKRQMTAAEIVSQVSIGRQLLGGGERLHGIVLMGMGEPLHNYQASARSLRLLSHPDGCGVSTRRLTLSTCGLVPQIDRLGKDFAGRVQLAVSLHASDDRTRSELMPVNRKYPLRELMAALKRYPLPRRRRITIEYTLINGVNDSITAARSLIALLTDLPVKVNLIALNSVSDSPYQAPSPHAVSVFQKALIDAQISAFIRQPRGQEIAAACGQLALSVSQGQSA